MCLQLPVERNGGKPEALWGHTGGNEQQGETYGAQGGNYWNQSPVWLSAATESQQEGEEKKEKK